MPKSVVSGVLFSDGNLPGEELEDVVVSISRQNALPSEIKRKMAEKVKAMGGNAVSNFEIAQSGHHWVFTASLLMWDSESLYGVGKARKIPKDKMSEAISS
jgi:hypothetical protein